MLKERPILAKIWEKIDSPDIIILNGARQVGKTTVLQQIQQRLQSERHIDPTRIHQFDLEKSDDLSLWSSQEQILAYLPVSRNEQQFIFLDEFQQAPNIGSTLKVLHDHYPQFKLIVTGSASWYISMDESLAGRKLVFSLWPLDFSEYIHWQPNKELNQQYEFAISNPLQTPEPLITSINLAYLDYLTFGGYPAVILASRREDKIARLLELTDSYIMRDVQLWQYQANSLEIKKLLTLLASQIGSLLDIPALGTDTGLGRTALINRLALFQNTFILRLVRPYFTNRRKELVKNPKIYLTDTGLRGSLLQHFSVIPQTTDIGHVAENQVALELIKRADQLDEFFFWRTKSGQEVGIVRKRNSTLLPIEVKSGNTIHIPDPLKAFLREYPTDSAYVLNWSIAKDMQFENCTVRFRPLWFPIQ